MKDGTQKHQRPLQQAGAGDVSEPDTKALQPDDLHNLFEVTNPAMDEDDPLAAMRDDPNYSALIRDLEYIAAQARLLFQPAELTPSDSVWDKIQAQLNLNPEEQEETPNHTLDHSIEEDPGSKPAFIVG